MKWVNVVCVGRKRELLSGRNVVELLTDGRRVSGSEQQSRVAAEAF